MKRDAHTALFTEQLQKTPEERDSIIQTGLYNSYIAGYLAFTLEDMGHSPEEIGRAVGVLLRTLDTHTAKEARQEAQERGL
jgi:hypothetical protein